MKYQVGFCENTFFTLTPVWKQVLPSQKGKLTDGENSKNSLGKAFSWGHSLAAGRYGISYAC